MHDLKYLIENRASVEENLKRRDPTISLDGLVALAKKRGALQSAYDGIREQVHSANQLMAQLDKNSVEFRETVEVLKEKKQRSGELKRDLNDISSSLREELLGLPNIISKDVPVSQEKEDSVIERVCGEPGEFDFPLRDHVQLATDLKIIDFERGAKIAHAGFPLYLGMGAKLELALINFMLDKANEGGFKLAIFPFLNNTESLTSSGNLPKFADEIYSVKSDDLHAIPTAEVPLTNLFRGEVIEEPLPLRMASYSPCFRREAGSYGKESRGLMRMHQFNKVETYSFAEPDQSEQELEFLVNHGESLLKSLGLHYRLARLPSCDLAHQSSQTKDIEIWIPSLGIYSEVSSASNCRDFQARRANIKFKKDGKKDFVHTLNCSALATPRVMLSLLESNQTREGTIIIPEALRPYTRFDEIIKVN